MNDLDLNLLVPLDALLSEGSVARAARRLHLSPSAMSRSLSRLRVIAGDPLLVRAGRGLVPTPRAEELRPRVGALVREAESVLRPDRGVDLGKLARAFTIRCTEGFAENFAPRLVARLAREAPGVRLRFVAKTDKESSALRDGRVDLETGVVGASAGPEVRSQGLFRDRWIGVARPRHSLSRGRVTPRRYADAGHILVSRRGLETGPVDEALNDFKLERRIAVSVSGYSAALALARSSDLVATVPERYSEALRGGLFSFRLPFHVPELTVSMLWHPRQDADPAHRWLRSCVREVCPR